MRAASCALLGSHETNRMQRSAYTLCSCAHDVPINFQLEGGSGEAQRAAFERVSQCVQEDCGSVSPASARLACTTSKHVHTAGGWVLAGAHSAQRLGRASERERGGLLVQLAVHRAPPMPGAGTTCTGCRPPARAARAGGRSPSSGSLCPLCHPADCSQGCMLAHGTVHQISSSAAQRLCAEPACSRQRGGGR